MRILCTADLHMGRVSSRLPSDADMHRFSARAAWKRFVNLALEKKVDLVAVAGDVIDASSNYFEAFGPLKAGLDALSAAGIDTFLIAGNHDFDSLPRFCDQLTDPRVHLLGRGANWERHTILRDGRPRLHVDGWSFRAATHEANPLLGYSCRRDGTPVLGLLHADVEQAYSPYARCSIDDLLAAGPDAWLLGHVHRPRQFSSGPLVFYPGSPQALDPGERDAHGVWLLEWPPGGTPSLERYPSSSIRYESFDLPVDGLDDEPAIETALHRALEEKLLSCATEAGTLELLSCRLRLCGRTAAHTQLARRGTWPRIDELRHAKNGITAHVERVEIDTRPALDLENLARGNSPLALLARLVLALESGAEHPLVPSSQQRLAALFQSMPVEDEGEAADEPTSGQEPPDAAKARALLLAQGHRLLAQLVETAS